MQPNYRRCVSCRKVASKQHFWRVVRQAGSHHILLNQGSGRSAYICPQVSCLQSAQRKNRLGRALKATVPNEIYDQLWGCLAAQSENGDPTINFLD
ncbi:MAG: YlxR family protein [Leptolyngbyaceae cyanobacterium]